VISLGKLFRTKSIEQLKATAETKCLKRTLGALDVTTLGIGAIIGIGIFVLTGMAAALYAGPGIILSFVIGGIACVLIALIYSELAAAIPVSGSTYTYAYAALGEIVAWVVGWDLILAYATSVCLVSGGWSGYVTGVFRGAGIVLPHAFTATPAAGGIVNLPAMFIPLLMGLLLIRGTKESVGFNRVIVAVKLIAIGLFVFLASSKVDISNWSDFLPFGITGVFTGAAIVFTAYLGFDAMSTTSEECRNPGRDVPIGIICSLLVCTVLYVIVAALLTGLVPFGQLNTPEPMAYALDAVGYKLGSSIVAVGAVAGITSVLMINMYGLSRVVFAISRDGFLPSWISKVHPRYGTPHIITLIAAVVGALVAGFVPVQVLAELVNIGTLFTFVLAAVGVLVLRRRQPHATRPFRIPAVGLVAPLAIALCLVLMFSLPFETWLRFIVWSAIGLVIYFGYSCRHSTPNKEEAPQL
jgi:basic amino acid/polyamine antiporter, APA family